MALTKSQEAEELARELEIARRDVQESERRIRAQKKIVRALRGSAESTMAATLLETFELVHQSLLQHVDLLERESIAGV